jgi:thiol:disulfide interchange protein DsbD
MRHRLLTSLLALCLLAAVAMPALAEPEVATTIYEHAHLRAELVSKHASLRPGEKATLGLRFEMDEHWHIYWRNPGEAGDIPTIQQWTLPAGYKVGQIQWPTPTRLVLYDGTMAAYVYEHEMILPVEIEVPADAEEGNVTFEARLTFLTCHEECVPGDTTLRITLPVRQSKPEINVGLKSLFDTAQANMPRARVEGVDVTVDGEQVVLTVPKPESWTGAGATYEFLPYTGKIVKMEKDPVVTESESTVTLTMQPRSKKRPPAPDAVAGLLVRTQGTTRQAWRVGIAPKMDKPKVVFRGGAKPAPVLKAPVVTPFETDQGNVSLVSLTSSVQPGTTATLGLLFDLDFDQHWHAYWLNPGDAGQSPIIEKLILPKGFKAASGILWPTPKRVIEYETMGSYVYAGSFILPFEIEIPADATEGALTIGAELSYQVCSTGQGAQCISYPAVAGEENPYVELMLPVSKAKPTLNAETQALFRTAQMGQPIGAIADERFKVQISGDEVRLEIIPETGWSKDEATYEFFPVYKKAIKYAEDPVVSLTDELLTVSMKPASKRKMTKEEAVAGLLVRTVGDERQAWTLGNVPASLLPPVTHPEDKTGDVAPPPPPPTPAGEYPKLAPNGYEIFGTTTKSTEDTSLGAALLLAFLGGLILNLMPCVLPVLSIKIMGFVNQAEDNPKDIRNHGFAFAGGVILSFLALAGLLLLLRAGGETLGWGFQMQEPRFVAGMIVLMFWLGLNMAGVFELGTSLQGVAGKVQDKAHSHGGLGGSFMSGVLATIIATPCTAPFMGSALGYALDKPTHVSLTIFAALGVGMALPYVLLSMFPKWLTKVPRPGPWMETFKQFMSFLLFGTVVWLLWVFGKQTSIDGMTVLLLCLTLIGLGCWLYGKFAVPYREKRTRVMWGYGLGGLVAVAGLVGIYADAVNRTGPPVADSGEMDEHGWYGFTHERVQLHQAAGKVVLLDFTADWCLTCLANDKAFLQSEAVTEAVEKHGVVKIKADWTKKGPAIAAALAEFDSASVPLYVVFPAGLGSKPLKLDTNITNGYVISAIEAAVEKSGL